MNPKNIYSEINPHIELIATTKIQEMELVIISNPYSNNSQHNERTKSLMGEPVKIAFTEDNIVSEVILSYLGKPYTPSTACITIDALTDTTKGT